MIKNLSFFLAKNDPDKLFELYDKEKAPKDQIIARLFELEEFNLLIELAKNDNFERTNILNELLQKKSLNIDHCIYILSWLMAPKFQKEIYQYIKNNFTLDDIQKKISHPLLTDNSRKYLESIILSDIPKEHLSEKTKDENYLKMKMILEDTNWNVTSADDKKQNLLDSRFSTKERIKNFLPLRIKINIEDEFKIIKEELKNSIKNNSFDLEFILTILNLSRLKLEHKEELILDVDEPELYFPENFQFLTEAGFFSYASIRSLFSTASLKNWTAVGLESHYAIDLFYLCKNYSQFNWLEKFLENNYLAKILEYSNSSFTYYLTSQYGFRLNDIIIEQGLKNKLRESCLSLHEIILKNVNEHSFDIEYHLKPLILVGGDYNFIFISQLLNKTVVDHIKNTIEDVNSKFLDLKRNTEDLGRLKQLIELEIGEKANLIERKKYNIISTFFLQSVSQMQSLDEDIKTVIISNLPNLELYSKQADSSSKILFCQFIGKLNLQKYKNLLYTYLQDDDYQVAVNAAIALKNIGDKTINTKLKAFAQSPNFNIRKLIATSLNLLSKDMELEWILKLASDENIEVSKEAIKTISQLPKENAINIFKQLISTVYYKNKAVLVEALGNLESVQGIPLLIDLLKDAESDVYLQFMKSLVKINQRISLMLLQNLNFRGNHLLELERAKSIVLLGDYSGWAIINSYINLSIPFIQNQTKLTYLQLISSDYTKNIRKMTRDPNSLIGALALTKLVLFNEDEGWQLIDRMYKESNKEMLYYISILLDFLPYDKAKEIILSINSSDNYSCKMITSIILAKNGDEQYLKQIENKVMSLSDEQHQQILKAIRDYPHELTIKILEKIALLQNTDFVEQILYIFKNFESNKIIETILKIWERSDEGSKIIIAKFFGIIKSPKILEFIHKVIDLQPDTVRAALAYALVEQGDEVGWNKLLLFINSDMNDVRKVAMDRVASFKNIRSLNVLVKYLTAPAEEQQIDAIKAIGSMQLKESVSVLKKYVTNSSSRIKIAVCKALGDMPFNETFHLLDLLETDKNDYVRVAVEISREKLQKGFDSTYMPVHEQVNSIFQSFDWRLSDSWFDRNCNLFTAEYDKCRSLPLYEFRDKIVMENDELEKKQEEIYAELSRKLIGCTDLKIILEAKKNAAQDTERLITKDELIQSILVCNPNNVSKEEWSIISEIVKSHDEKLLKAVIFMSAKSSSKLWVKHLKIISGEQHYNKYLDLILYSLSKKMYCENLSVLVPFLESERVRYYFLYFCNYLVLHGEHVDMKIIQETEKYVTQSEFPPMIKEGIKAILLEIKRRKANLR